MRSSQCRTPPQKGDVGDTTYRTSRGSTPDMRDGLPGPNRIVLIDDDWIALSRLRESIEQNPDLVVVAACRCAGAAMLAVQRYRPAVVILDVQLPDRDGIELIRDVTAISDAEIIVFTAALQKARIVSALRSGAKAVAFKDQPSSMLISCVRKVLAEEPHFAPPITPREPPSSAQALTAREREVAQWAAAGARNKEIAWQLGISEGTVKLHLFRAYRKLKVGNRVELVLALRKAVGDTLAGITFVSITFVSLTFV
jgi:two-component system, NarL family, nitrate/nitrite response regulator NarL